MEHSNYIDVKDRLSSKYYRVNEQSAVLSNDPNERLKQYLDDDDLLEKLASKIKTMEVGEKSTFKELGIDSDTYGFRKGDELTVKRSKDQDGSPKFTIHNSNIEEAFEDVDFSNAAFLVNRAASGIGTDEEAIAGVAGALINIAASKNIDASAIFNKFENVYNQKYDESLKSTIEGEFSGRAEVAALNAFRLKIDDSVARSLNLGAILGDLALTVLSFGTGTAAAASLKGATATARGLKYAERASKASKFSKLGKIASPLIKLEKSWMNMSKAMKTARLNRLAKSGKALEYTGKGGTTSVPKIIAKIENGQIWWKGSKGGAYKGPLVNNVIEHGGLRLKPSSIASLVPGSAKKIAAGVSVGSRLDNIGSDANFLEIMGWYDSLAKNPESYIKDVKSEGSDKLAETLIMLQDGTGIFGNTTDQEELQIALILTSITPDIAREVDAEFKRKGEGSVSDLISDELGGDLAIITNSVWNGMIGGADSSKYVSKILKGKSEE